MTIGDVFNWVLLLVAAGAIFLTVSKVRKRKQTTRRQDFLERFKASREGKAFHEDLERFRKDDP